MKKVLPPTYFFISVVVMVLLALWMPMYSVLSYPWYLFGMLPIIFGLTLNYFADSQFKRAQTTIKPFEESSALVTDGVFGFSRNPMYLGIVSMLIGLALLLGSLSPWVIVVIFFTVMNYRFIRNEELMLDDTFGEEFERYRKSVRKWI